MPEKILLLNVHSDRNAGDLALSRVTIQQLQDNFPGCDITLSMNDPGSYDGDQTALGSFFTWIMTGGHWHYGRVLWLFPATIIPVISGRLTGKPWLFLTPKVLRAWVSSYTSADLVVSTAGGFYRSSGKGLTLLLTAYSLVLALLAGKPLYIFPQSIGPFDFKWECLLARWIFSRARIVMVREPISATHLRRCGLAPHQYQLMPDVAFGFQGEPDAAAENWLIEQGIDPTKHRPLLGMTVIDWAASNPDFKNQEIYEEAIVAAIRLFSSKYKGKILLLPQTWGPSPPEDDRITARRIANIVPELKDEILVIEQPLKPELLQAVFGMMDLVIGTRMHSNIFSISRGVPVIPIGYLHKSLGIAEVAGLEKWVLDIDHVDASKLIEKINTLWAHQNEVRNLLKNKRSYLVEESQKAGKLVAQDFAKFKAEK